MADRRRRHCCYVRRYVRPWTISNRFWGRGRGAETRSTVIPNIWNSYADAKGFMPDYGYLSLTTSNPAWSPLVSPLGAPTLTNGPGNGALAHNRFNRWSLNKNTEKISKGIIIPLHHQPDGSSRVPAPCCLALCVLTIVSTPDSSGGIHGWPGCCAGGRGSESLRVTENGDRGCLQY